MCTLVPIDVHACIHALWSHSFSFSQYFQKFCEFAHVRLRPRVLASVRTPYAPMHAYTCICVHVRAPTPYTRLRAPAPTSHVHPKMKKNCFIIYNFPYNYSFPVYVLVLHTIVALVLFGQSSQTRQYILVLYTCTFHSMYTAIMYLYLLFINLVLCTCAYS